MTNRSTQTTRRIFTALAALAVMVVTSTPCHAVVTVVGQDVTFTTGGTFDDTGTWLLTAEFTQTALDDWNVFVTEMTRLDVQVTRGNTGVPTAFTYTEADRLLSGSNDWAFVFSGVPAAPVFEHYHSPVAGNSFEWFNPLGPGPSNRSIALIPSVTQERGGSPPFIRNDNTPNPYGALAPPHPPPNNIVPEPITATLGLIGLGVLGMATRRRAA